MRASAFVALLLLVPLVAAQAASDRLAGDLDSPVDLAFAPGGRLLLAELASGKVRELRPDGGTGSSMVTLPASAGGNGGFTGLAADPNDAAVLYVVYSFEKASATHGKVNRVSKVVSGQETVLLDDIPWAPFHVGGRVALGPDGFLYVTTGDNGGPTGQDYTREPGPYEDDAAQDPQSLIGKVLRLSTSGAPAGGVAGWDPYVYAMGFRNPFGLAFGSDGALYAAENGIVEDELDVVMQGANYGWPLCEGVCARAGMWDPITTWDPSSGTTGAAFLGGKVYVGEFSDGKLHAVALATGAKSDPWVAPGPILDVAAGPDGCLYVSTFDEVWEVDVAATGSCRLGVHPPPTPTPTPTPTPAPTPTPTPAPTPSPTPAPSPTPTVSPPSPSPSPPATTPAPPTPTEATPATPIPVATAPPTNVTPVESQEEERSTPSLGTLALIALAAALALGRGRQPRSPPS